MMRRTEVKIEDLIGKIFKEVFVQDDAITFMVSDTEKYRMMHVQDCCEEVYVEDVCGDVEDLIGTPIIDAYEKTEIGVTHDSQYSNYQSYTWTFYRIRTAKGTVTIRWCGTSNGYYSEEVDLFKIEWER